MTHPRLPELNLVQAVGEIDGSRTAIARELDRVPKSLAYPCGSTRRSRRRSQRSASRCACGVCDGFNTAATSLFALRRIEIHGTDSLLRFIVKLLTGRRNPDRGGGRALVRRRTSAPR